MNRLEFINRLNRRKFIRNSVIATTGAALVGVTLPSCRKDDDFTPEGEFGFMQGVASFDPTQTQVVLWTRYTPAINETNIKVLLDVATSSDFSDNAIIVSQEVTVDSASDYTIKVDVSGLTSNTKYYYRFRNESTSSTTVTGETKTLPANGEVANIKMAAVSCANYQAGLFNVYGAVAQSDADVVIHLGDYIYEYAVGGYGTNTTTSSLGREHLPIGEIVSLDDYRARYRQYRSDVQLQEAHRLKPFICVWDDHEIANDAYKDGAENHQDSEGSFDERKANALQAWHEYLPARVQENSKIYRAFNFGGIVDLMMLDTRIVGRDKQLDYTNYFTPTGLDAAALQADWLSPTRTILGAEQRTWLIGQIASSSANWQVIGSQVLMAKYMIPVELLALTAQIASAGGATPDLLGEYQALLVDLVTIKSRILAGDPTVTAPERARVETVLPYNLDAWDGYPVEREMIFASANGKKLITLAGDTHNAWYSNLMPNEGAQVGTEFATASVSSPGLEAIFGTTDPTIIGGFQQANQILIDDLNYVNASQRGFVLVDFSAGEAKAEWLFVNTLATEDTMTTIGHTASVN